MTSTKALEDAVSAFAGLRPRLFHIAHRILGSTAEAEDVVQDAWLRWQNTDRAQVLNPPAYLTRTTARLALNVAQSARSRHETAGPLLAEPVDTRTDPVALAERAEALELALLLLLEKLDPTERAAYVLRVAFEYSYSEIADNLQLSQVNTRQLVSRAHKRLFAERRRKTVSTGEHRRFLEAFVAAAQSGNLTCLEDVLTVDHDRDRIQAAKHTRRTRQLAAT
ncbi:sigma-70 family RNA polymerase sigma factor [Streptomyces sp. 2A115]|uniref:sigma-70 family RNA polymerase sigma factor n=1 Tax=Streptomyces sp. 2A115 TaxID=3457439 RepID=UPI003FD5D0FC